MGSTPEQQGRQDHGYGGYPAGGGGAQGRLHTGGGAWSDFKEWVWLQALLWDSWEKLEIKCFYGITGGFPGGSAQKNPPAMQETVVQSIPGLGSYPGGGHGNSLQDSCLENSMDRGAWRATVYRVTKSRTRLSAHTHTHTHTHRLLSLASTRTQLSPKLNSSITLSQACNSRNEEFLTKVIKILKSNVLLWNGYFQKLYKV